MERQPSKSVEAVTNRVLLVGCSLDGHKGVMLPLEAASDLVMVLPTISIENIVAMVKQLNIGYVIIGKRMGIMDLRALVTQIREVNKQIRTLLYFKWDDKGTDLKYLMNGVDACVHRGGADSSSLLAAIKTVEAGGVYLSPIVLEQLKRHALLDTVYDTDKRLSRRERQVVDFITSGLSIKEMAELTKLSTSAVSTYKRRLFKKLGVKNVVELLSLEEKA